MDTPETKMDLSTMEACVEHGARVFEAVETKLDKLAKQIESLDAVLVAANSLRMMGALQTMKMRADGNAAIGRLADAKALIARLHIEATEIAVKNGKDLPVILGGGGR